MLDISLAELLVVICVIIIFVAPKNLPTLGRSVGRVFKKVRNFIDEIKNEIDTEERIEELKKIEKEMSKRTKKL
jgi:sec-independent protein translocase protein TatB